MPSDSQRRIARLERDLAALKRELAAVQVRDPRLGRVRSPRLAETAADPSSGLYPAKATHPNTYWIRFVDATYNLSAGDRGETVVHRQALPLTLAHNLLDGDGSYVPQGQLIAVFWDNGRWWFEFCCAGVSSSSSSGSSSASSASSASSGSGGSSGGGNCEVEVVTNLTFDQATCVLNVCKRLISFPQPCTVGQENCPSSSSSSA